VNDDLHLRKVSYGFRGLLHDLEGVGLEHFLNHNLSRVLSFSYELIQHSNVFVLEFSLLLFVKFCAVIICLVVLEVLDDLLD